MTYEGKPFKREKYKAIIQEQVSLSYLTQGGVTYSDSDEMTPYERQIAIEAITDLLKAQRDQHDAAMKEAASNRSKTPKTLRK